MVTTVLEEAAASNYREMAANSHQMIATYLTSWCRYPEDRKLNFNWYKSLRSHVPNEFMIKDLSLGKAKFNYYGILIVETELNQNTSIIVKCTDLL